MYITENQDNFSESIFFFRPAKKREQMIYDVWWHNEAMTKGWQQYNPAMIYNKLCVSTYIYIIIITIHYTRANERNKCFTKKQWKMRIRSACELSLILVTRLKWLCFIFLFLLYFLEWVKIWFVYLIHLIFTSGNVLSLKYSCLLRDDNNPSQFVDPLMLHFVRLKLSWRNVIFFLFLNCIHSLT